MMIVSENRRGQRNQVRIQMKNWQNSRMKELKVDREKKAPKNNNNNNKEAIYWSRFGGIVDTDPKQIRNRNKYVAYGIGKENSLNIRTQCTAQWWKQTKCQTVNSVSNNCLSSLYLLLLSSSITNNASWNGRRNITLLRNLASFGNVAIFLASLNELNKFWWLGVACGCIRWDIIRNFDEFWGFSGIFSVLNFE